MKLGICDTTFARCDMAQFAISIINSNYSNVRIIRKTVPGVKDLPLACKLLLEKESCEICLALGMPGPKEIDRQCAHEASAGLIQTQLMANKPIIEVFVYENEATNPKELFKVCKNRTEKHTLNAVRMIQDPEWFIKNSGKGLRQGFVDAGPLI
ncbi:MAG: riboflavin synthase [Candidatus Micrarchaeia archaeon]|jgi:riboflavin synthase